MYTPLRRGNFPWPGLAAVFLALAMMGLPGVAWAACPGGSVACGSKCIPYGTNCCAGLGFDGKYCDAGWQCTSDGQCYQPGGSSGGGSSCSGSQIACGSGCIPVGADCCVDLGFDGYCDPGTTCTSGGKCQEPGGSSGGGSTGCGSQVSCGSGCIPVGADCCVDLGFEVYCDPGTTCTNEGKCRAAGSSSGGGSPTGSTSGGSTSGGSSSSGNRQCSPPSGAFDGCSSVRSCCEATSSNDVRCWYDADGKIFDCGSACTSSDVEAMVNYCSNGGGSSYSSREDDSSDCAIALTPGHSGAGIGAALACLLGALLVRRRLARSSLR